MSDESIPLRDYVEHIYAELQAEIDRRFTAQEKIAENTAISLTQRLEGMNEFRSAISDTLANSVGRNTFDVQAHATEARFTNAEIRLERIETSAREQASLQTVLQGKNALRVTVIGVLVVIVQIVIALLLAHHLI